MAMECRSGLSFALPVDPPSLGGRRCASNVFISHLLSRERKLVVLACVAQLVAEMKFGSRERKLVCITSGNSYFGAHLIRKLLVRGYMVRATIQNQGKCVENGIVLHLFHLSEFGVFSTFEQ